MTRGFLQPPKYVIWILLLALPLWPAEVRVTYLANEAVMIEDGGHKVLVDALLRDSLDNYARHPPDVQEKIETGQSPFDGITLALATHYHLDHWDAGAISRFLKNNPGAVFASTPQATGMLATFGKQVRRLWPDGTEPVRLEVGGVRLSAFRLEHGKTQNLGYRIEMGGKTLLHAGDGQPSQADFQTLRAIGSVDVAMLPYWWFLDEKALAFLKNSWRPRRVIVFHVGSDDRQYEPKVLANWPDAWFCTEPGQSRTY